MSSLRHSVLEKTLRRSLRKMQDNSIHNETDQSIDGSLNKSASNTCARTRKRPGTMPIPEEKSSTDFAISNTTELQSLCDSKKMLLSKAKKQDLVDMVMDYMYKCERLRGIVDTLTKKMMEHTNTDEIGKKDLLDIKNKLLENVYTLEGDKFKLEETVQELSDDIEDYKQQQEKQFELEKKIEELSKEVEKYKKQQGEKEDVERLGETIIEPLHTSVMQPPSTPRALSRLRRRSMLNQTITTWVKNNEEKPREEILENVIIEQEDILDFYSLLCGVSIWKEQTTSDDEEIPDTTLFNCKLQVPSLYNDLKFNIVLNFTKNEIEYQPFKQEYSDGTPSFFKNSKTYDADEAYLFVKNFLDVI